MSMLGAVDVLPVQGNGKDFQDLREFYQREHLHFHALLPEGLLEQKIPVLLPKYIPTSHQNRL